MREPSDHPTPETLEEAYNRGKTKERKLKRISRSLTLVTVLVFSGFLFLLFVRMSDTYALENFEEPLQAEAERLMPTIRNHTQDIIEQAAPEYSRLAREKLKASMPEFQEASRKELESLSKNLTELADRQIQEAVNRVMDRQQAGLQSRFPNLATEEGVEEIRRHWSATINRDTEDILYRFHNQYSKDVEKLRSRFDHFRDSQFETMDEDQLTRYFVHLWLMKLDHKILNGESGGFVHVK